MGDAVTVALGVAAVVITVVRAGPQALRLLRHPEHVGVSVVTWALALMTGGLGCSYGIFHDEPANLVANALQAAGAAAVLTALARHGRPVLRWVAVAVVVVSLVVVADRLSGEDILGYATIVIGGGMFVPQAVRAVKASTTAGISAASWWLVLVAAVIWSAYGVAIGRWVVVAPGFIQFPAGVAVLWRLHTARGRSRATEPLAAGSVET
jgi:uncharacterized protein with PQ loop repeat